MTYLDDLFAPYNEHLTVAELAEVLGIRVPTAYKWLKDGTVPGYKIGSAWVILRDEVKDRVLEGSNIPRDQLPGNPPPAVPPDE